MALAHDQPYELAKSLWIEKDFDKMGWHDVRVHAVAFDPEMPEIRMDIDYILAWANPATTSRLHSGDWLGTSEPGR
jgi:hypothetical protein